MGILCGACKEGFSVSIITVVCMPNSKCGADEWFWLVVILAAFGYTWWYVLKDDIFTLFFHLIRVVKNIGCQPKPSATDVQVELTSVKRERVKDEVMSNSSTS